MTFGQNLEAIKSAIYANIANTFNANGIDPTLGITIIDAVRARILEDAYMQTSIDLNAVTAQMDEMKKEKEQPAAEEKSDA